MSTVCVVLPEAIPRLEVDAAQEREIEKKSERYAPGR